ncbi:epiphycan [Eumetopias jubatus]|uniref:epiphycan n=1 Tax=Eumetopias jubatus TaxID=34886 RepID=UPI0010162610|nr:epiphycan [Eumetopias jubatus]
MTDPNEDVKSKVVRRACKNLQLRVNGEDGRCKAGHGNSGGHSRERINREKMNHWTKTRGTPKFKGQGEKEVADKGTDKASQWVIYSSSDAEEKKVGSSIQLKLRFFQMLARLVLGLVIFNAAGTAPTLEPINYDSETYDATLEDLDNLYNYENIPIGQAEIEIATVMPSGNRELLTPPPPPEEAEEEEEEESTPRLIDGSSPQEPEFTGVLGPHTNEDFPTCLLCTCISTTVYCDDHELDAIPALPKNTAYFYSRFNRIKKIHKNDFASLNDLRRIDLTSNLISEIHEDAFRKLPHLRELVLRDNKIRQLPELPNTLTFIDISNNRLGKKGIKQEAFKDMYDLHHLYLTDNNLDHIPLPLPENLRALHLQNNNILEMHEDTFCNVKNLTYIRKALEDIRLDGNPINLSKTPQAYMCLPRLPIGSLV